MNANNQYIGVFDSGLGGLTVLKELKRKMPKESFIYFGDTGHLPYGNKSKDSIIEYSLSIVKFLINQNIKAIIVACNTASAVALDVLKQEYSIPILNVIDPSIRRAINKSKTKAIGVIGTETTISSQAYKKKIRAINKNIKGISQPCPLFVPIIEEGLINQKFSIDIANFYLKNISSSEIDTLILGCTHYPLFKNIITQIINPNILIIDSAKETARCVLEHSSKKQLLSKENKSTDKYYVSDKPEQFDQLANMFLGIKDINVNHIRL